MVTVGAVFRPQLPPEELRVVVGAAEEAGLPELWLWEDCFLESGASAATAALAWSERLRVGVGLYPVPLRNPALLAMEIATIERLFPGRSIAALGHGVGDWMAQVGERAASPMTRLREHVDAVRDLLDGLTVDVTGDYVRLDEVALDWPPAARPPLLLGGRGPRTLALAGARADGLVLDAAASPDDIERARRIVDESREGSGRPGRATLAVYHEIDPGRAGGSLAEVVADAVGRLGEAGADDVVLQGTGTAPDPRPLIEALVSAGLVGR